MFSIFSLVYTRVHFEHKLPNKVDIENCSYANQRDYIWGESWLERHLMVSPLVLYIHLSGFSQFFSHLPIDRHSCSLEEHKPRYPSFLRFQLIQVSFAGSWGHHKLSFNPTFCRKSVNPKQTPCYLWHWVDPLAQDWPASIHDNLIQVLGSLMRRNRKSHLRPLVMNGSSRSLSL